MAVMNVNPTRMELTRLKKQLNTALRGHKLLKDKRDELMRQFLERIRENKVLRERVEQGIREANSHFVLASAVMQKEVMDTALLSPRQEVYLETTVRNVMSVEIPAFSLTTRTSPAYISGIISDNAMISAFPYSSHSVSLAMPISFRRACCARLTSKT